MAAVGLRGAVAYGLALNLPQVTSGAEPQEGTSGIPAIEAATLVLVVASTLLFGGLTGMQQRAMQRLGTLHQACSWASGLLLHESSWTMLCAHRPSSS